VRVRTIEPSDYDDYARLLEKTSDEDRFCRFFHVVKTFDPREIHRFVDSQPDVVGLIAEDRGGLKLGVAHGFLTEAHTAEVAVLVTAEARRRGIGVSLLTALIAELQARGCSRIIAYSLSENHAFANLARAAGLRPDSVQSGTVTWVLLSEAAQQRRGHVTTLSGNIT
jgi:GNAT superfamily N-acetyltransferase